MNPRLTILSLFSFFATYNGRIGCKQFWLGFGALVLSILLMMCVVFAFSPGRGFMGFFLVFTVVYWIATFAIVIKRLHDRDKSGWWSIVYVLGPQVLGFAGEVSEPYLLAVLLYLSSLALLIWTVVDLGILRGTVGENRFGPDPTVPALASAT